VPFLLSLVLLSFVSAPAQLSGVVVDQEARPIPLALVFATDRTGKELARTFTALDGSFRLDVATADGCLVEARLTGFEPSRNECDTAKPMRVVLAVASVSEVVVVSATRTDTPAGQVGAAVTSFNADELDRRQRPMLSDLLRSAPGATVVNGIPGAIASLFLRGGESNYTKVLLDGIPLNEPGGGFDFSNVGTAHLGRVELVRGAHSSLFGSDAVAGVLHLFTRRARPGEPQLEASIEGGNFATFRGAVTYSNASPTWDYSLHATQFDTDNEAPNSAFDSTTISAAGGVEPARGMSLRFVTRGVFSKAGTPGQTAFGRPDLDASFERNDLAAGGSFSQQLSPALHHSATYSFATSNQVSQNTILDPKYTPAFGGRMAPFEFFDFPSHSDNDLSRHHLGYQFDAQLKPASTAAGHHVVTLAVDWDGERATLRNLLASHATSVSRNNIGATIQDQMLWPRVFVTAGVRLENNDSFGFAAVPRASVAIVARERQGAFGATRLKMSAGAGIKEPTILQSFSPFPSFPGNPDLEPERSRTFDVGVEQTLLDKLFVVEATYFANRYRDIISTRTVSFSPFVAEWRNVGLTSARGFELSGQISPYSGARLRAGYTHLDSEVIDSASDFDPVFNPGEWLLRRPRHSGFLEMGAGGRGVDVTIFGTFTGRTVDSDFSSLSMTSNEGHARWDIRGTYKISKQLTATVAIDNLLSREYMEPLGYPALRRAVRIGVRAAF
jgi:vitamin B12 transporter